jgi:alkyl hydroperoxide reductase subunit AhpF
MSQGERERGDLIELVAPVVQAMVRPVTLRCRPVAGDPTSEAMMRVLEDLAAASPLIAWVPWDSAEASRQDDQTLPDGVVTELWCDGKPTGIRYLGFPGGHEFSAFLEALVAVSTSSPPRLPPRLVEEVAGLSRPVHLEVFVAPT